MNAPTLAATIEREVSTAPVGDTGQADRLATVVMPTAAAVAVRLGLPVVPGSRSPASLEGPTSFASLSAAVEPVEDAPRIDIVLQDDRAGDVLVDGTLVASGIDLVEAYTVIVALVLDTAGQAGRPAQVSVTSGDSIRRTLVAPDGSIRRLEASARCDSGRPTTVASDAEVSAEAATPASPPEAAPGRWPGFQFGEPTPPQTDAPLPAVQPQIVAQPDHLLVEPPLPAEPIQQLTPGSPWPGSQRQEPVTLRRDAPVSAVPSPIVALAQSAPGAAAPPQATLAALAPVPLDPPAGPTLPAVPTARPAPTAPSDGATGTDPVPPTGPAYPHVGVRPGDDPQARSFPPAPLVVVGAHGGAGESSLAALVPGWCAAGHAWPAPCGVRQPVVLVARTSLVGLTAARAALTQWSSGQVPHVEIVGLVLIADAPGRLPRSLRDLVGAVSQGGPPVWRVPWVKAWRTSRPQLSEAPKQVKQLVRRLDALTTRPVLSSPVLSSQGNG
jgi:hypothetical protein